MFQHGNPRHGFKYRVFIHSITNVNIIQISKAHRFQAAVNIGIREPQLRLAA